VAALARKEGDQNLKDVRIGDAGTLYKKGKGEGRKNVHLRGAY